jgi:tRNA (guanine37-N1)-methyltransferase
MVTPSAAAPEGVDASTQPLVVLDRASFARTRTVAALRVPVKSTHVLLKALRGHTLDVPKVASVVRDGGGDGSTRLVLLKDDGGRAALPPTLLPALDAAGATDATHALHLTYDHLASEEVLRSLLPEGVVPPSSFETIGHIAHVNLKPAHAPFKHVIGAVLLDKNPGLRTVVNKTGDVGGEFRVFQMEVLAGDPDTVATVAQHGCRFRLDFQRVYWNSRLEAEHARLVSEFRAGDVVVDAMAGVGPFAVPAARKGCTVYANDLNPDSFKWLQANVVANKARGRCAPSCADARAFIRAVGGGVPDAHDAVYGGGEDAAAPPALPGAAPALPPPPKSGSIYQHAILNLPANAVDFLDAFVGSLRAEAWGEAPMPRVHVYGFAKDGEQAALAAAATASLGGAPLVDPVTRLVRDVAPAKRMWCLSFTLPREVAVAKAAEAGDDGGVSKRQKFEGS